MEKTPAKSKLLVELANRKIEAQKSGAASEAFRKFQPKKPRNGNIGVGPSWGPRKGN